MATPYSNRRGSKDVITVFCDHRFVQLFQVLSLDYHIELIVENRIVLDLQTGVVHFSESTPIKGFHATSIPFQDFIRGFAGLPVNEFEQQKTQSVVVVCN